MLRRAIFDIGGIGNAGIYNGRAGEARRVVCCGEDKLDRLIEQRHSSGHPWNCLAPGQVLALVIYEVSPEIDHARSSSYGLFPMTIVQSRM
jgi:hypothetical protein